MQDGEREEVPKIRLPLAVVAAAAAVVELAEDPPLQSNVAQMKDIHREERGRERKIQVWVEGKQENESKKDKHIL